MAFRNKAMTMPNIEDIIMQIMAISQTIHGGDYTIGRMAWNEHRPPNWPTALYILKTHGYTCNSVGWSALIADYGLVECQTFKEAMIVNGAPAAHKRWNMTGKPDYTANSDSLYATLPGDGLPVCVGTYRRTGRMVLR